MRVIRIFILLLIIALSGLLRADVLKNYRILTEQYPPFNYQEGEKIKGLSTEILLTMLKRIGSNKTMKDIELMPWARCFKTATENKGILLYSTTRSIEREKLFKWVGPIAPNRICLFAKKGRKIKIENLNDIHKYRIGAIRDDIGHHLLLSNHYKQVDLSADMLSNLNKLNANRIDLWAYDEIVARWEIEKLGYKNSDYEVVYVLLSSDLYFTFSLDTPDLTVRQMRKHLIR